MACPGGGRGCWGFCGIGGMCGGGGGGGCFLGFCHGGG